jgi:integrase
MREGNKLSAASVRTANKPGLKADGDNLYLQVSKFGTKAWLFRYMKNGVARKMGLGAVHTVSLAEARKRAAEARLKVHDGIDPIDQRKASRVRERVAAARAITFKACADRYIEANRAGWRNAKHGDQWIATFNETRRGERKYPALTAAINDLPVDAIDTALVLKVLEPIWQEKPETANRARGRIESVLSWATVRGHRAGDNPARWRGHLDQLLPGRSKIARVKHHDAVPYADMPGFMGALRDKSAISARALEFTILTAARTGETIGARWSEFDLLTKLWIVPPERMKGGKEHRAPLSDRAVEILSVLPRTGNFVFRAAKSDRPISSSAMLELVRGMRGMGATVHGFRSSFRDWAAEQTAYPTELCEMALAHAVGNKVEAAYKRGDMMEKRRRLMADWAAYCERAPAERDNVGPFRELA